MTQIRATHVGSLPRTAALTDANQRYAAGEIPREEFLGVLQDGVDDVVKRQRELGLDLINDGEFGHVTSGSIDFGAWWAYIFTRLGGLRAPEPGEMVGMEVARSTPGNIRLTSMTDRRDWTTFQDAYMDPEAGVLLGKPLSVPTFVGPVSYIGEEQVNTDINLLTTALTKVGHDRGDAFVASISPGSAARLANEYFDNETEIVDACAEALHHEYKAITDAGLTVQIDAPDLAESWDQINPEPSVADYRAWVRIRVDAINRALKGLPKDQTRLHICWGSWHGPHTTDIPFAEIIDEVLRAEVGGFTFEGASPRHAHEWRVWQDHELPDNTLIYPGVVCHSTNVVEHPRTVADRILQFAEVVGPERVVASTDCGLGGRLHEQLAWAKLESLVQGAQLASKDLTG